MASKLTAVKSSEFVGACRYTGYVDKSIRLVLECGHEQFRKASAGIPKAVKCQECSTGRAALSGKPAEQGEG